MNNVSGARVIHHHRTFLLGGKRVGYGETRVIGACVVVDGTAGQTRFCESGPPPQRVGGVEGRRSMRSVTSHYLVEEQTRAEFEPSDTRASINGPGEGQRVYEMWRDAQQYLPLSNGFAHQVQLTVFEISYSAVDQAR